MRDESNGNLLEAVRQQNMTQVSFNSFAKISRLSGPGSHRCATQPRWQRTDSRARDLPKQDRNLLLNSQNEFNTFIGARSGTQSCPRSNAVEVSSINEELRKLLKINEMRLENFQNYKKLRRRMDHAYLKVRQLQRQGKDYVLQAEDESDNNSQKSKRSTSQPDVNSAGGSPVIKLPQKVKNPLMTDNIRTYNEISSTFSTLHNQQQFFSNEYSGGTPTKADLFSPILSSKKGTMGSYAVQYMTSNDNSKSSHKIQYLKLPNDSHPGDSKQQRSSQAPFCGSQVHEKRMRRLRKLLSEKMNVSDSNNGGKLYEQTQPRKMAKIDLRILPSKKMTTKKVNSSKQKSQVSWQDDITSERSPVNNHHTSNMDLSTVLDQNQSTSFDIAVNQILIEEEEFTGPQTLRRTED